jgi:hypothetical protein
MESDYNRRLRKAIQNNIIHCMDGIPDRAPKSNWFQHVGVALIIIAILTWSIL